MLPLAEELVVHCIGCSLFFQRYSVYNLNAILIFEAVLRGYGTLQQDKGLGISDLESGNSFD
jgi:hypothetical protein